MPPPSVIVLRPFQRADKSFFAGLAGDERVTRFVGDGLPWQDSLIEARVSAALDAVPQDRVGAIRWFVAENAGQPVGLVVSTRRETGVEIGYWVSPEHWGQGIAGAMVDEALTKITALFGVSSLLARVDPGNEASVRVLSRRGFTLFASEDGLDYFSRAI